MPPAFPPLLILLFSDVKARPHCLHPTLRIRAEDVPFVETFPIPAAILQGTERPRLLDARPLLMYTERVGIHREQRRMEYLDFELEIGPGQGRDYPVAVVRSPAGKARETLHFPFDKLALDSRLKDLQIAILLEDGEQGTEVLQFFG